MNRLITILKKILQENNHIRIDEMINEFQNFVWLNENFNDNDINANVFIDLADIFEYYESNLSRRNEDSSYFGKEKLKRKIQEALEKINLSK